MQEDIGVSSTGGQGGSIGRGLTGTGCRQVKRNNTQLKEKTQVDRYGVDRELTGFGGQMRGVSIKVEKRDREAGNVISGVQ